MSYWLGNLKVNSVVEIDINTFLQAGGSATVSTLTLSTDDIKIYKDSSLIERTSISGVTLSIDHDTTTGCHIIKIDTSDNTDPGFYSKGSDYKVKIVGVTIDGQTVNAFVGRFSIENRYSKGHRYNE